MEKCGNCERTIGNVETKHVFQGHVVCTACYRRLSEQNAQPAPAARPVARQKPTSVLPNGSRPSLKARTRLRRGLGAAAVVVLVALLIAAYGGGKWGWGGGDPRFAPDDEIIRAVAPNQMAFLHRLKYTDPSSYASIVRNFRTGLIVAGVTCEQHVKLEAKEQKKEAEQRARDKEAQAEAKAERNRAKARWDILTGGRLGRFKGNYLTRLPIRLGDDRYYPHRDVIYAKPYYYGPFIWEEHFEPSNTNLHGILRAFDDRDYETNVPGILRHLRGCVLLDDGLVGNGRARRPAALARVALAHVRYPAGYTMNGDQGLAYALQHRPRLGVELTPFFPRVSPAAKAALTVWIPKGSLPTHTVFFRVMRKYYYGFYPGRSKIEPIPRSTNNIVYVMRKGNGLTQ